ncbi:MAG: hypothetical protein WDZ35_09890 [Crocinitomicaceae bacterium]
MRIQRSVLITFFLFLIGTYSPAQIERGSLILPQHPPELTGLINKDQIDLKKLRELTNFLTNRDIKFYQEVPLKKRKKAFLRHIKHLSEKLEWEYFNKVSLTDSTIEILYEMLLFEKSMKHSAILEANSTLSFQQKRRLLKNTKKSLRMFSFERKKTGEKTVLQVKNSPFWHQPDTLAGIHLQFDDLAKQKKIKARKRMVIVFKELSYSGSTPKIKANDLDFDNEWSLKWGDEAHTDVLGSRIFAALGYDVDHPYFYGEDQLTLVFDGIQTVKNSVQLVDSLTFIYGVDISPFISTAGIVTQEMAKEHKKLNPYIGFEYVRFKKCFIEGRPDRVKRIGTIIPGLLKNEQRRELRAALLAHAFIGNWDTREENTALTTVHDGNYNYRISAVFADLGTSLGVKVSPLSGDFKVGLVNELSWEVFQIKKNKIILKNSINAILKPYQAATYEDLRWMADKIRHITGEMLAEMIDEAGWPAPIAALYFQKMASRRASILLAFDLKDPHPIPFDKMLTVIEDGVKVVDNGKLIIDYEREKNPESFLSTKGRKRNYGH